MNKSLKWFSRIVWLGIFVNLTIAQAKAINLVIPDPVLRYNETTENWEFGEIDWDEFWRVVKGDGPCNRERLAARRKAQEDGAWVRHAAMAHAEKARIIEQLAS